MIRCIAFYFFYNIPGRADVVLKHRGCNICVYLWLFTNSVFQPLLKALWNPLVLKIPSFLSRGRIAVSLTFSHIFSLSRVHLNNHYKN